MIASRRSGMPSPCSACDRHRLAEAEFPSLEQLRCPPRWRFSFVGDQHHRLAGAPHDIGEGLVVRQQPVSWASTMNRNEVCIADRDLGLRPHASPKLGCRECVLEARSIDHLEVEVVEARRVHATVAGDAGCVVDQRQLAADQAIEQGRLAGHRRGGEGMGSPEPWSARRRPFRRAGPVGTESHQNPAQGVVMAFIAG